MYLWVRARRKHPSLVFLRLEFELDLAHFHDDCGRDELFPKQTPVYEQLVHLHTYPNAFKFLCSYLLFSFPFHIIGSSAASSGNHGLSKFWTTLPNAGKLLLPNSNHLCLSTLYKISNKCVMGMIHFLQFRPMVPAQQGQHFMPVSSASQQFHPVGQGLLPSQGQPPQFSQPMQQLQSRPLQPGSAIPSSQATQMPYYQQNMSFTSGSQQFQQAAPPNNHAHGFGGPGAPLSSSYTVKRILNAFVDFISWPTSSGHSITLCCFSLLLLRMVSPKILWIWLPNSSLYHKCTRLSFLLLGNLGYHLEVKVYQLLHLCSLLDSSLRLLLAQFRYVLNFWTILSFYVNIWTFILHREKSVVFLTSPKCLFIFILERVSFCPYL